MLLYPPDQALRIGGVAQEHVVRVERTKSLWNSKSFTVHVVNWVLSGCVFQQPCSMSQNDWWCNFYFQNKHDGFSDTDFEIWISGRAEEAERVLSSFKLPSQIDRFQQQMFLEEIIPLNGFHRYHIYDITTFRESEASFQPQLHISICYQGLNCIHLSTCVFEEHGHGQLTCLGFLAIVEQSFPHGIGVSPWRDQTFIQQYIHSRKQRDLRSSDFVHSWDSWCTKPSSLNSLCKKTFVSFHWAVLHFLFEVELRVAGSTFLFDQIEWHRLFCVMLYSNFDSLKHFSINRNVLQVQKWLVHTLSIHIFR